MRQVGNVEVPQEALSCRSEDGLIDRFGRVKQPPYNF